MLHIAWMFPYTPSHRRRGATAVLVRHKPQWHRHDRRGSAALGSVIDRRSTVENLLKPRTFAMAQRKLWTCSKLPQCHRGLGQSRVGSPRQRHDCHGTVYGHHTMTAVAPPSPSCPRSSTSITAVPPQYNRRASAVQPPCNREQVDWRPYSDPVAVLLRLNVWRVWETMKNYWRCHYGDGGFHQKP